MDEPSVLDYLKSRLMPWKYPRLNIPDEPDAASKLPDERLESDFTPAMAVISAEKAAEETNLIPETPRAEAAQIKLPWRSLAALILALAAQWSLAPGPERSAQPGVILLAGAIALLVWAYWRNEWRLAPVRAAQEIEDKPVLNLTPFLAALATGILTFISFASLEFNFINTSLLLITVLLGALAFLPRISTSKPEGGGINPVTAMRNALSGWRFSWRWLAIACAVILVIFFRYYRLQTVPPEMNSDHAEKILDVLSVLNGHSGVFFPSNGGREALQFYLVAALHKYLHIPLGYDILKLVTITVGFLALPFIYLIGKEIANRRAGWLAFILAGIAYWPNVVSRVGMRLPFYMLFTASILYFLLRGIRSGRRRDYILAGIALGISFYGYSADRILPFLVLAAVGIYLLSPQSSGQRLKTVVSTFALAFMAFIIFLPLLRFMLEEPQGFFFRTLTRMGSLEKPLEGPVGMIFLSNLWNALKMFSWSGGVVWPISIPDYPALGMVSGGLFYLGAALVLLRFVHNRNWLDIFLLLSIPILMLPSILSLAFPAENPNLYRTGGVIVPAFLMVGLALDGLMKGVENLNEYPVSRRLAWGLAALLITLSILQEYDLVFNKYYQQYRISAWNSSEMGQAARNFTGLSGRPDSVWVVGYPHWVDTRLVALNAGFPGKDFQIFPELLESTLSDEGSKMFILNPQDATSQEKLKQLYPSGWFQEIRSQVESKDFMLFLVPPGNTQAP